jgi:hypothetical protein
MKHPHFAVGEVAVHWNPGNPNHAKEVTIAGPLREANCWNVWQGENEVVPAHRVDLSSDWVHGPHHRKHAYSNIHINALRKKHLPREEQTTVQWAACPWQPKGVDA